MSCQRIQEEKFITLHTTQIRSDAVERGKELAQSGDKGQIIIHKKDGSFQTEHTYKNDPYPPKG
jgi:hypothetical protein